MVVSSQLFWVPFLNETWGHGGGFISTEILWHLGREGREGDWCFRYWWREAFLTINAVLTRYVFIIVAACVASRADVLVISAVAWRVSWPSCFGSSPLLSLGGGGRRVGAALVQVQSRNSNAAMRAVLKPILCLVCCEMIEFVSFYNSVTETCCNFYSSESFEVLCATLAFYTPKLEQISCCVSALHVG